METLSDIPVSIRLNPFKECSLEHLQTTDAVPWCPQGWYLKERPVFTLDPLFHAGAYYVQDASAMFVGYVFRHVLEHFGGRHVLDLCAAPGGKSTDAASSLRLKYGPGFVLVSNEVIRSRAAVLRDNMAMWGDPNVVVTSSDAREFAKIKSYFDIIIADVPCSGEGMFRKSENARKMWSEDNVELCAARSRRIVADAWDALAPGGVLIYSTCTLNQSENDDNVRWICEELGGEVIPVPADFQGIEHTELGHLLVPGKVRGEGQYCAAILKNGERRGDAAPGVVSEDEAGEVGFFSRGDEIYALPAYLARQMQNIGKKVNVLGSGIKAFTLKGKDKIPDADLALSTLLEGEDFPSVELSREQALKFLHKDALVLPDAPTGYVVVTYGGLALGFVKNLGNRANNLHPASRRILMSVEGK